MSPAHDAVQKQLDAFADQLSVDEALTPVRDSVLSNTTQLFGHIWSPVVPRQFVLQYTLLYRVALKYFWWVLILIVEVIKTSLV